MVLSALAFRRATRRCLDAPCAALLLGVLGLAGPAVAQPAPQGSQFPAAEAPSRPIYPIVGVSTEYTDNLALAGDEAARRGWITDIYPGLRIDLKGARLKVALDYQYHRLHYSDRTFQDTSQQSLSSSATLEAIDKFLYIDASAGITGQNRSAFGPAVPLGQPTASLNRAETRTVRVAPYVRGPIGDAAVYQARFNASEVRTEEGVFPDTRVGELSARVRNASVSAKIGWAIDANVLTARNDLIGNTDDSRIRGSIIYGIDPLFHVSASYGYESTDFLGPARQTSDNPGAGFSWTPSPRAQVAALVEKRFFGTGHSAQVSYRTERAAFQFVSTRDAAVLPSVVAASASTSVLGALTDLLAATIPDPVARAEAARRRLEDTGMPSGFPLATNFLTVTPQVLEGLTASAVMLGPRTTASLSFNRLEQRRALSFADAGLPENPNAGEGGVRQTGLSLSVSHKVTPITTLTASATGLRTEQLTLNQLTTRQSLFSLNLTSQLGPRTTASVALRHSQFDSPVPQASYRENAVVATVQFKL